MIQAVLRGRDGENRFGLQHPLFGHWIKRNPAGRVDGLLKLYGPREQRFGQAIYMVQFHVIMSYKGTETGTEVS